MAKYNTSKMLASYTSDFGDIYTNIPVRWTAEAFEPAGIYTDRVAGCGNTLAFEPRYLLAQFPTGAHKYAVPTVGDILTMKNALVTAGALCVDLVGEKWSNVPENLLGGLTYKSTP